MTVTFEDLRAAGVAATAPQGGSCVLTLPDGETVRVAVVDDAPRFMPSRSAAQRRVLALLGR